MGTVTSTVREMELTVGQTIIDGFDQPPYQIAIGGGEPTSHPDFPYILRTARQRGTVPNWGMVETSRPSVGFRKRAAAHGVSGV